MATQPCRFHRAPGGCRYGKNCKFAHISPNSAPSVNSPGSPGPSAHPQSNRPHPTPTTPSSVPSGACRFYWTQGNCKREFECRFRHITPQAEQETPHSPPRFSFASDAAREIVAPFLTENGLAKINGTATDGFFAANEATSLSPTDAHSRLKRFFLDNFKFKSSFEIYGFLTPLGSANSSNKLWTQEEGQLLLRSLTSANGSLRIAEIINWPEVSMRAGQNKTVLSFQRGILPLLRYMSSEFVVKSTLMTQANHLYSIVLQNLPRYADVVESCMEQAMKARSFKDPATVVYESIDAQLFASIAGVLHEFLVRFKNAVANFPRLSKLVTNLCQWFKDWHIAIKANPLSFDNPFKNLQPAVRDHIAGSIQEKVDRLAAIVEREQEKLSGTKPKKVHNKDGPHEALVAALHTTYQGPGLLRAGGPRHDNDFEDISKIRIAPTNDELMSREPPFLPANFFSAPHHAPSSSMQRLLDIQFRLLREELIAPLRKAVQLVHDDLNERRVKKTKLAELLQKQGGKYRGMVDTQESLMFNVYTGVEFVSLVPDWKGMSTSLVIDTPPGRARSDRPSKRVSFWESMSGKRLSQGGLVALVWVSGRKTAVHLGVIANSSKELTEYLRQDEHHIKLRIVFFDSGLELRVLQELRNRSQNPESDIKLLVESPVMFEAIRPFLEALQTEPEDLPFSRYLVHQTPGQLGSNGLDPPRYARLPNFKFQLASLFDAGAGVNDLTVTASDPKSIEHARTLLRRSRLDPSQADAVLDTLTREVALIQGPPGTGKSFTGVEILRVLQANHVGPILMIAFTNHALDHMLCSVLDAQITNKVVRLGRRASDERIAKYSIETLEMAQNQSRLDRAFNFRRDLKDVQQNIADLMKRVLHLDLENDSAEILKYMSSYYPEHHDYLSNPPLWLLNIRIFTDDSNVDAEEWQKAGRNGKARAQDNSTYAFWKECTDLTFINQVTSGGYAPPNQASEDNETSRNMFGVLSVDPGSDGLESDSDNELVDPVEAAGVLGVEEMWKAPQYDRPPPGTDSPQDLHASFTVPPALPVDDSAGAGISLQPADFQDMDAFFASLGFKETPSVPCTNRPLGELLENVGDVWTMSVNERQRIHRFWVDETRAELGQSYMTEFERLRKLHADKLREVNEIKEETRRTLLHNIDIIGCTTTGAAQLTTLLKGLSPKVLLVEEAGQVMEAHILGSLVPSIEHLILIGDPLQLRPTLNNFSLSMDSKRGRALYKFDMSLMERLSESGLAMSTINVQRRMRPTISSLIRNTLYPRLEDHQLVHSYPNVRGIQQNVFFVTHTHKENDGGDETASKFNTYEVEMICDLVLYLLRQGCYSDEGDIVVLCAYLGQLARLRDALASEVTIVIDERDQAALDDQESDDDQAVRGEVSIERVNVTKRVRLRTVDNYQGEEGRIVILSLVRNAGGLDDELQGINLRTGTRPTIGFLKSENRTNVALSRAREGLFIFGNADNLSSRSRMWQSIIEELEGVGCVGPALPIACHRHPDTVEHVSKPGVLPQIAPDGGCLRSCETRLKCGHLCPFKCHCDDPNHVTVVCSQPCTRLCPRDHPCSKLCSTACGQCVFPVANVTLPCGHVQASVECYKLNALETVYCDFEMEKALPTCEHTAVMACGQDPSTHHCVARCGMTMSCCSKSCSARCHKCQTHNVLPADGKLIRSQHHDHPCEKSLHCGHRCQESCSQDHEHTAKCQEKCRQSCVHAQCRLPCSVPCAPCKEPCAWNCTHYTCPVPCGSVCIRLPCDQPCTSALVCGHRCPSVCGENCAVQVCPKCAPAHKKDQVVDLILSRTLLDVMPELGGLDELLITIPSCGHVFTVETLDGHTGINDFYSRDTEDTKWTGLRAPSGFVKPPTCPSCRSSITSNRYGRIVKRADLDILERNVASHMFQSLDHWQSAAQNFDESRAKTRLTEAASTVVVPAPKDISKLQKQDSARKNMLKATKETPMSESDIRAESPKLHYIDSVVTTIWRKATQPLFHSYKEIVKIAETRSAHTQAWEASFSFLYDREIQAGLRDPARMPRRPQEHAMRMAKLQVGQPRPLADRRVLVEAFWASIHIRLTIIRLAQAWLDESGKSLDRCPDFHRHQWAKYISYLLQSCRVDAEKALKVADNSRSHRQILKSVLLCMRINLEAFRFNFYMSKKSGSLRDSDVRNALCEKAVEQGRENRKRVIGAYMAHFAGRDVGSRLEEEGWVKDNFTTTARAIIAEWHEIEKSIRLDTFYEPVSLEEKMNIIRAFSFGSTGHFYTCQNGHIFAITECGGAMERSRCPECGQVIGGADHHLDQSNQRATEFEELARQVNPNVGANPWANPY
ncbi:hypothetical protein GALMADRAFT_255486 [Galerina marginata CBS 339.88]|uniref:P-loop containing nucleoside triphosphate hydrolase protein n=1 Tax=Galerina marginata (strain CBS 339.88) TaxID=685588 RepID=A0A067STK7_GALM3|nr:hypothetical protein GALMADRAFT_255486 [Galerina marginata CBS 339.88]